MRHNLHIKKGDLMDFLYFKICWSTNENMFRYKTFSHFTAAGRITNFPYLITNIT